jgi:hypothetical protein
MRMPSMRIAEASPTPMNQTFALYQPPCPPDERAGQALWTVVRLRCVQVLGVEPATVDPGGPLLPDPVVRSFTPRSLDATR